MADDRLELKVEGKIKSLDAIDDFIASFMARFGAEEELYRVRLAVNEACANIIQHAYSGGSEQPIKIVCSKAGGDIVIRIWDWGKPFESDSVPVPDTKSELSQRKLGGLGILLMRQMMHEVKYVFHPGGGNELIMTRHLSGSD